MHYWNCFKFWKPPFSFIAEIEVEHFSFIGMIDVLQNIWAIYNNQIATTATLNQPRLAMTSSPLQGNGKSAKAGGDPQDQTHHTIVAFSDKEGREPRRKRQYQLGENRIRNTLLLASVSKDLRPEHFTSCNMKSIKIENAPTPLWNRNGKGFKIIE